MLRLASFLFQSPAIKCFHSNNSDNEYTPSILPFLFYITPHSPFFYPHMSSQFVTDVYSGFDDYEHAYDSQVSPSIYTLKFSISHPFFSIPPSLLSRLPMKWLLRDYIISTYPIDKRFKACSTFLIKIGGLMYRSMKT